MSAKMTFLVVEDDETVRRALKRSLSHHGSVDLVGTCAAARMALRSRRYDGAVLDVGLPDGNGISLVDLVRKTSGAIHVLVLTGSTDHGVISAAHAKRVAYLLKPFDLTQLELFVNEARDRRDAAQRRIAVVLESWIADCQLSRAEAELLELGAAGYPREQFAKRRGVKPDTIRVQIKSLLNKTGHSTFEIAVNGLLREALREP